MAIVTTDNQHYSDIANAIRAKGISGSFKPADMPSAIMGIRSNEVSANNSIAITATNESGWATSAEWYSSDGYVPQYMFGAGGSSWACYLSSLRLHDDILNIGPSAFRLSPLKVDISRVRTIGSYAFSQSRGFDNVVIPASCTSIGQAAFYQSPGVVTYKDETPEAKYNSSNILGALTNMVSCQLGSVGNPLLLIGNTCFNATVQSTLTITIYCTGDKTDSLIANIRNKATGATIIAKASESTVYNGVSYLAGDTLITSEATL